MILYRTSVGIARREGDELAVLGLQHSDLMALWSDHQVKLSLVPTKTRISLADATLLAPVERPSKIILHGLNYHDHAREAGFDCPTKPVFVTLPQCAVTAYDSPILLPPEAPSEVDYEGEIAILVGRHARNVKAKDAWQFIGGLTLMNDVSARDIQVAAMKRGGVGAGLESKTFPSFKPLGPGVLVLDDGEPPPRLKFQTLVNGELRQEGDTAQMIFSFAEVFEAVSHAVDLVPGDVISTGTPSGVGLASGKYLRPGDVVEIVSPELGRQHQVVVSGSAQTQ